MTKTAVLVVVLGLWGCSDGERRAGEGERHEVASAPPETGSAEVPAQTVEQLEALGYVPSAPTDNPQERGVTESEDGVARGVNLYSSRRRATALLVDASGQVLHRWEADDAHAEGHSWMHVEPLPGGALLAITKDHDLAKLDRESELVWRTELRVHHDLAVHEGGQIYAIARDRFELETGGQTLPVLADLIVVLSRDGTVERSVPLLPLLKDEIHAGRIAAVARSVGSVPEGRLLRPGGSADVFHTNSIAFLTKDIEGVAPAGSVLISCRSLNRIAILDASLERVLWTWGAGELQRQHDAKQLANGHILLFDNGPGRGHSRVLEVDAAAGEVVWKYESDDLYSALRGGAQELSNGNVLITESDRGHAIEVTREGEVVWEFWNPEVHGTEPVERDVIYRLNRFPRALFGLPAQP